MRHPGANRREGFTATIGWKNVYVGDERVGAALKRAHADATAWVEGQNVATTAATCD